LAQGLFGNQMLAVFALWPVGHFYSSELHTMVGFHVWQLVTSAFLHASWVHIGLNMYALFLFGRDVEKEMGSKYYLILYFAAVLSAGLVQLFVSSLSSSTGAYPTIGASGGVFGVLLAFGILYPQRLIFMFFPPIALPAWLFVIVYGLIELANGVFGTEAGVAHFAHLGGMLGGYLVIRYWQKHQLDTRHSGLYV